MNTRRATPADIDAALAIIEAAQRHFREVGIPQWTDGYPGRDTLNADVAAGISYVLEGPAGEILGTSVLQFSPEPTYAQIYEGVWLTDEGARYACIHRIALAPAARGTGAAAAFYQALEGIARGQNAPSIRVDTHRKNLAMQRYLAKCGFQNTGLIYLESGAERLAFEKLL